MKNERDYLIRIPMIMKIDCLLLLGMITNYNTPDIAMLRWIAYIKSLNLEFKHIARKNNLVADMLSRARYKQEEDLIDKTKDIDTTFYFRVH